MKKIAILSVVMIMGAGNALAGTLNVPFFFDSTGAGVQGFISVKNTTTNEQTITIIYTSEFSLTSATPVLTDLSVTYALPASTGVSWRPVVNDIGSEGSIGNLVPDNTLVRDGTNVAGAGSAQIVGVGLAGRYVQITSATAFGHALLPQ